MMTNPRIQAIEQEILALAQPEAENPYSRLSGGWAREVVESWNENTSSGRLATLRNILEVGHRGGIKGYHFSTSELKTQVAKLFNEWNDTLKKELEQKIAELETKLAEAEAEQQQDLTQLQALNQELNEVQAFNAQLQADKQNLLKAVQDLKQNLTNTLKSLQDLQTENKNLHNQTEQKEQRILALETDKTELTKDLTQQKQKWTKHINQAKQQITQEIKLIKEVLNG